MANRKLNVGEKVYCDDTLVTVLEGPFRTLDTPGVDQYRVKSTPYAERSAWASDLLTEEEYFDSKAEEGCRE